MEPKNTPLKWQRTNVTNLVRNGASQIYYARVRTHGKDNWKSLETTKLTVAKLRLADFERQLKARGAITVSDGAEAVTMEHFMAAYLAETENDPSLAPNTKARRKIALKAIRKTWPELAERDASRVTVKDCQSWAANALREGTGFVAPNAKTTRKGMSASAFNKCLETLQAVLRLACDAGAAYANPAKEVSRAKLKPKRLELPTPEKFQKLVQAISEAGSRQSKDCADMVRLLAYSGMRLREATALRWQNINWDKKIVTVPGTKSASSFRQLPILPDLGNLLEEMRNRREPAEPTESVLKIKECKGALRTACAAIRIKRLTHHDLRHLFATTCIECGVDIPTVSRWLGHSDGGALAMRTYGHLRQEHSQMQAAKVAFA